MPEVRDGCKVKLPRWEGATPPNYLGIITKVRHELSLCRCVTCVTVKPLKAPAYLGSQTDRFLHQACHGIHFICVSYENIVSRIHAMPRYPRQLVTKKGDESIHTTREFKKKERTQVSSDRKCKPGRLERASHFNAYLDFLGNLVGLGQQHTRPCFQSPRLFMSWTLRSRVIEVICHLEELSRNRERERG